MIKPPFELKCEYLTNPIELDTPNPRLSWLTEHPERNQNQSAFHIIVSSNRDLVLSGVGDMWDSEKIVSHDHINIPYEGKPLKCDENYYWRVKWWDKNGKDSEFSEVASFGMALMNDSDWKAKWISRKEYVNKSSREKFLYESERREWRERVVILKELPAIYLRKGFEISKKVRIAKAYVCGLGYYEFRLNGKKVGNKILDPAQTDYRKVALYSTYDITERLKEKNAVGIILGNGRCVDLYKYGFPKLIFQININYIDGTEEIIISDDSWNVSGGPILENGIYYGERYDARLELVDWDQSYFDDKRWDPAVIVEGFPLASQMMQPIQITKRITPKKLFSPSSGLYVYDFGQNFTGFVKLKVHGPRGTQVKLRFSEIVHKDGTLNTATNGNALATDIYILKGEGEEIYKPHFTYHGFRYVELSGYPGVPTLEAIEGLFFHSNIPKVGEFFCSNQLINQIHSNVIWGQLSNLMSIPTDSPQRNERHGWMGDAQLIAEEAILNFDMARFYTKYLRDIKFCQLDDGSISDVVPPYWRLYHADPVWGTAYITITWYLFWYYNDLKILEDHYEHIKAYIGFLSSVAKEDILDSIRKYGDWCPPSSIVPRKTPVELTATWYYYHDTHYLSKIAKILGKEEDSDFYKNKAEKIKVAFNKRFLKRIYDAEKLSLADRTVSQTSNILPLYLNMVPEKKRNKVLSRLITAIKSDYDYHFDTGIVGTRYIFDTLTDNGYPDVIYKMINQESFPGYGYMIREGATTLWERWEKLEGGGMNSHNHIMLGSVDTWFYKTLAGIKSLKPGWEELRIKPYIPHDLSNVGASIKTVKGFISSSWEKTKNSLRLTITIPVGCKAEVWLPIESKDTNIKEGQSIIWNNGNESDKNINLNFKEVVDNSVVYNIGSGFYEFCIQKNI
ncbi:MAG: family 78 glycoside hydrolase catalytic domain [Promethearchaeota archaeon]|jgi:alpha-L-rhamnosidase